MQLPDITQQRHTSHESATGYCSILTYKWVAFQLCMAKCYTVYGAAEFSMTAHADGHMRLAMVEHLPSKQVFGECTSCHACKLMTTCNCKATRLQLFFGTQADDHMQVQYADGTSAYEKLYVCCTVTRSMYAVLQAGGHVQL